MPPRRSSRTRASVEPTAPATKRKRNEPEEIVEDEPEEVKPAARTRRSTSVQPTKPRTSTRSRKSLEDVQEEEEEREEKQMHDRAAQERAEVRAEDEPENVPRDVLHHRGCHCLDCGNDTICGCQLRGASELYLRETSAVGNQV